MAQRTENEETEFKVVPETISLCGNCGALATTNNLCLKCFNTNTPAAAAGKATKSFLSTPSTRSSPETQLSTPDTCRDLKADALAPAESSPPIKRVINRCSGCRRKVGLTGFRCRCGELFCADHRYSDRHDCSYDYKSAGREVIARENPVVKAAKIVKI